MLAGLVTDPIRKEIWNGEPVGPAWAGPVATGYFNDRKLSIFGGSNEVQREIITKAILEL